MKIAILETCQMGSAIPAVLSALNEDDLGPAHFNIDSIRKDLRTMLQEGSELGYALPAVQSALNAFDQASAGALGQGDGPQLAAWWLKHAKSS